MKTLAEFPRVHLAHLPTEIEDATRLAYASGLKRLLIKRDDNTGLAMGGNKARKLEFLMADARSKGADVVLAWGGVQSNHIRMTAAAARKLGMRAILFIPDAVPDVFQGNLILDTILGAQLRFLPDVGYAGIEAAMTAAEEDLRLSGHTPFSIPLGGSTPLGAMGYVNAVHEAAEQLGELGIEGVDMVVALGSGGTLAGLTVGCELFSPKSRVIGISVVFPSGVIRERVLPVARGAAELLEIDGPDFSRMSIYDGYVGKEYGVPTEGCKAAILLAGQTEGLILDPVYTGKAMAGCIDLAKRREIGVDRPVLFWHTGGAPALFAYEPLFHEEALHLASED